MKLQCFLLTLWLFSRTSAESHSLTREKRFLIFPPTAPTRHQFIFGIGIPLDLESVAVTTGYVLKAQYFLPTTPEHLRISPVWETKKTRRDAPSNHSHILPDLLEGHREVYNADSVLIDGNSIAVDEEDWEWMRDDEEDDKEEEEKDVDEAFPTDDDFTIDHTRWHVYRGLEAIANERGFGGRACVLRVICETAEVPFNRKSGILAELIHILLTPSTSSDPISQHSDNEYFRAEQLGRSGVSCAREFRECSASLLDVVSAIHNPLVDDIVKILA
ncbi:uncharacterized protein LOC132258227 [Phlebotomus argentipes]|uniref:uncharacterized protein LOC132258227 n=1 Tax=Phlebotomus argentipes TaxID=94469 RepID=UPI00289314C9|nr:uncharacterized protein LOC132258227 [Phlebotomus argentipes]